MVGVFLGLVNRFIPMAVAIKLSLSDRLKPLRNRWGIAIFPFGFVQYWTAIPAESRYAPAEDI
ncbi:MAG TPA: hypothetical protein VI958_09470 [Acidobacteriota bacterium]